MDDKELQKKQSAMIIEALHLILNDIKSNTESREAIAKSLDKIKSFLETLKFVDQEATEFDREISQMLSEVSEFTAKADKYSKESIFNDADAKNAILILQHVLGSMAYARVKPSIDKYNDESMKFIDSLETLKDNFIEDMGKVSNKYGTQLSKLLSNYTGKHSSEIFEDGTNQEEQK